MWTADLIHSTCWPEAPMLTLPYASVMLQGQALVTCDQNFDAKMQRRRCRWSQQYMTMHFNIGCLMTLRMQTFCCQKSPTCGPSGSDLHHFTPITVKGSSGHDGHHRSCGGAGAVLYALGTCTTYHSVSDNPFVYMAPGKYTHVPLVYASSQAILSSVMALHVPPAKLSLLCKLQF